MTGVLGRIRCRLFGHGPFYQRVLPEVNVRFIGGCRDDGGRALTWPTCDRCGWKAVTMRVIE